MSKKTATKKTSKKKAAKKKAAPPKYQVTIDGGNGGVVGIPALKDLTGLAKERLVDGKNREVTLKVTVVHRDGKRADGVK